MNDHEHELLNQLAERCGIAADYHDIWGVRHVTSSETKRAILTAMGVPADSDEAMSRALTAQEDAPWRQLCDPVLVLRSEQPAHWSVRVPVLESEQESVTISWELHNEAGHTQQRGQAGGKEPVEVRTVDGLRHARYELPVPPNLPIGYYDVQAKAVTASSQIEGSLRLVVAPSTCFLPPEFQQNQRVWGLAVQLYALRSAKNWGVGDFGDLEAFVEWAAKDLKAGLIGLNPLHALKNTRPYDISPYSPTSRLFLNMLYLDVERIPDFHHSAGAQRMVQDAAFQRALAMLRAGDKVDYDQVAAAKRAVLESLFATFRERELDGVDQADRDMSPTTERGRAFMQFIRQEGEPLELFALFQALAEEMRRQHPLVWVWQEWPEPFRSPHTASVAAFRVTHHVKVQFFQYVQWLAAEQLAHVARHARQLGMPIGLYHDLALGSDRTGSDAWVYQDMIVLNAEVGCPPDEFGPQGQNWGLPPLDPHKLRASGYRLFTELLRRNLASCGALRLDHVMGLFRLFWIPRGTPASAGAYVSYPVEDLLGILALESVRHQAVIIGEDLGTVPEWIRERLAAAKVLSYRVLYFERGEQTAWKVPEAYPRHAMAVVTTHDLPTLVGYWTGQDIELRTKLGLYPDASIEQRVKEERGRDKVAIVRALNAAGLLPAGMTEEDAARAMTPELCVAIHEFLGRSRAWAVMANLEDLLGEAAQTNVPGTVASYPNWSRKISLTMEALRDDPRPHRIATALRLLRP